jgi:hypothetical protein
MKMKIGSAKIAKRSGATTNTCSTVRPPNRMITPINTVPR